MPRARSLVYVVWELTLRCDLACHHCGSRAGRARDHELSTDEALEVVHQLAQLGAREVTLIGGEAYLRDDWHVIARAIADAGMTCSITTAARAFTPERARLARDARVSSVSISIDGLRDTHDALRGLRGSFDAALEGARALADAGVAISANTQISRPNAPELEALFDLFASLSMHSWQVQLTVPMGRAAEHPAWLLQPHDLLSLFPRLARLATLGRERPPLLWPANNIGYFGPHEATLRGRGLASSRHFSGCIAGSHALGIEADGTIKGCPSLPTTPYASARAPATSLVDLWHTHPTLSAIGQRGVDTLWGFCRGCYYADVCLGGCTWTSHVIMGRPGNNPYCHHRALDHARRGLRERLVQRELPPGEPFDHGRFDIVVEPLDAPEPSPQAPARRRLSLLP